MRMRTRTSPLGTVPNGLKGKITTNPVVGAGISSAAIDITVTIGALVG